MAKRYQDSALKLANLGVGIAQSACTGNPLPAIGGFVDLLSWTYGVLQQEYNQNPASQTPTQTVSEVIDSIMDGRAPRAPLSPARPGSWVASRQPTWMVRLSESDRKAVQARVRVTARSPEEGSDFDWLRALFEVRIAQRAEQIARSPQAGSERDNWLQAECEVLIAQRARQIAASPAAAGQLDNMLRAEREVLTKLRAEQIARSPRAGSERDNWLQAEREVLIAQRVRQIAASPAAAGQLDNWLMAERGVLTELLAAEIARSPQAGSERDNWLQAERDVLIAQHARHIAASRRGGGDLDNWLKAERDLEAQGVIKPHSGRGRSEDARPLTVTAILRIDLPNRNRSLWVNAPVQLSPKVVSGVAIVAAAGAVAAVLRRRRRNAAKMHESADMPVDGSPATEDMDAEAGNAAQPAAKDNESAETAKADDEPTRST
jgi:hypothetical protein